MHLRGMVTLLLSCKKVNAPVLKVSSTWSYYSANVLAKVRSRALRSNTGLVHLVVGLSLLLPSA